MAETTAYRNWLPLTFYMEKYVVSGAIHESANLRLTDCLNQVDERNSNGIATFIDVNNADIVYEDGIEESQSIAFLNRDGIILVVTEDGDLARGIGASVGPKRYPFVQKSPVQVVVETSTYRLTGLIHCSSGQAVGDVLHTPTKFLPMTDIHIRPHGRNTWSTAPFAALNKSKILSLAQEKDYI